MLACDCGNSRTTGCRYLDEVTTALADKAPELQSALERTALRARCGPPATIIPADCSRDNTLSIHGEIINVRYYPNAHAYEGNVPTVIAQRTASRWLSGIDTAFSAPPLAPARQAIMPAPSPSVSMSSMATPNGLRRDYSRDFISTRVSGELLITLSVSAAEHTDFRQCRPTFDDHHPPTRCRQIGVSPADRSGYLRNRLRPGSYPEISVLPTGGTFRARRSINLLVRE